MHNAPGRLGQQHQTGGATVRLINRTGGRISCSAPDGNAREVDWNPVWRIDFPPPAADPLQVASWSAASPIGPQEPAGGSTSVGSPSTLTMRSAAIPNGTKSSPSGSRTN